MRTVFGFLMIVLSPLTSVAASFTLNQGYVDTAKFCETLTYKEVRGLVVLDVKINGRPGKFLLDTGAPTMIKASIQNDLRFPVINKIRTYDINDRKGQTEVVLVKDISLGKLSVKDLAVLIADDNDAILNYLGVDGIIGSNTLRNMIVKISSFKKTVTFTNDLANIDPDTRYKMAMSLDKDIQSSPVIKVNLGDGITEELLFDSGFDGFYTVSSEKFELFKNTEDIKILGAEMRSNLYGMHGKEKETKKYKLLVPLYRVAGFPFINVIAYTTDCSNSKLGAKIFKYCDITLDYINGGFYIQPHGGLQAVSMQEETEAYYCIN